MSDLSRILAVLALLILAFATALTRLDGQILGTPFSNPAAVTAPPPLLESSLARSALLPTTGGRLLQPRRGHRPPPHPPLSSSRARALAVGGRRVRPRRGHRRGHRGSCPPGVGFSNAVPVHAFAAPRARTRTREAP